MRLGVRALFGLVLVGFAIQLVLAMVGRQPYPGLFQPGFAGASIRGETRTLHQPSVMATYADGSTATFTHLQVMAQAPSLPLAVFRSAFASDSPRRSHPQTVAWLRRRLFDLGGGRRPISAVVSWRDVVYDLNGKRPPRVTATDRTIITFGDTRD